jgi:hypothetical protein
MAQETVGSSLTARTDTVSAGVLRNARFALGLVESPDPKKQQVFVGYISTSALSALPPSTIGAACNRGECPQTGLRIDWVECRQRAVSDDGIGRKAAVRCMCEDLKASAGKQTSVATAN